MEFLQRVIIDTQEALRRPLFRHLILKVPHAITVRELLEARATFGQDATLEAAHVEQQIRIILAVD